MRRLKPKPVVAKNPGLPIEVPALAVKVAELARAFDLDGVADVGHHEQGERLGQGAKSVPGL